MDKDYQKGKGSFVKDDFVYLCVCLIKRKVCTSCFWTPGCWLKGCAIWAYLLSDRQSLIFFLLNRVGDPNVVPVGTFPGTCQWSFFAFLMFM